LSAKPPDRYNDSMVRPISIYSTLPAPSIIIHEMDKKYCIITGINGSRGILNLFHGCQNFADNE